MRLLTFDDLISLLVIRGLRDGQVPMSDIKAIERQLAKLWGVVHPFANARFRTAYGAVITDVDDQPVAVTGAIQEIFYELIQNDLHDVSYDAEQRAHEWRPRPHVVVRPDLQFGAPCIEGTRVTTRTIKEYVEDGDTLEDLATEFEISLPLIEAAYDWERSLAKAA